MYTDKNTACVDDSGAFIRQANRPWLIRFSQTLSFKQGSIALIVAISLGLLFGLYQMRADLVQERLRTDETFDQVLQVARETASQAAYALDSRLADNVAIGLLEYDAVVDAQIVDSEDNVLAHIQRPTQQGEMESVAHFFFGPSKRYQIDLWANDQALHVGTLALTVDTLVIAERFFEHSGWTLLSGLLRYLMLAAILGGFFYFMLTRPLQQVAEDIKTRQSSVDVPKSHLLDELGDLIESYNQQFRQRARAQERLHRLNQELEGRVAKRTQQLETAKQELEFRVAERTRDLHLATEVAEAASRAKSDFLAHMSHELRTPLNAIVGFSQIWVDELFGEIKNPKYKEYAADINKASTELLSLINDILDVSKVEAGEMELDEARIVIKELFESCVAFVRQPVTKKRIVLDSHVAAAVPDIKGDPRLIRQILLNLLQNAVKYTDAGGRIVVKADLTKSKALRIRVIDNGCGIAANDISRVLEPFSQIGERPDITQSGAGLGLPIAKRFTELHGGTLNLESAVGEETTVTVIFPASMMID